MGGSQYFGAFEGENEDMLGMLFDREYLPLPRTATGAILRLQRIQGDANMKTPITIALMASALAVQTKTSTPAGWTDDYDAVGLIVV